MVILVDQVSHQLVSKCVAPQMTSTCRWCLVADQSGNSTRPSHASAQPHIQAIFLAEEQNEANKHPDHSGPRNSGPGHWQSIVEENLPRTLRVQQENWITPAGLWARNIDHAVRKLDHRPLLVAHSFGCLAAAYAQNVLGTRLVLRCLSHLQIQND